jgi:hypothetical protein
MLEKLMNYLLERLPGSGCDVPLFVYPQSFFAKLLSIRRYGSLHDPPFQHKSSYL